MLVIRAISLQCFNALQTIVFCIAAMVGTTAAFGQTLERQKGESATACAERWMPDTMQLAHSVIETKTWGASAIIAWYGYDDTSDVNTGYNTLVGHVYIAVSQNTYRDIALEPILEDGGYPEVLAVFFANADKDTAKELVVLCKYDQRHYDYSGELYNTFIFDDPHGDGEMAYLEELSKKFWGCECGWRNGRTETARYTTAKAIKAELKRMGW